MAPTDGPVTFLSLPAEIRNRIYTLSGCLQFWEPHRQLERLITVPGDYCPALHKQVHGCPRGAKCRYWDDSNILTQSWKPATIFINPSLPDSRHETPCLPNGIECHIGRPRSQPWRPIYLDRIRCNLATAAQPELTKVSRQIRQDTLPMFYGSHTFVFRIADEAIESINQVKSWLGAIGKTNAKLLRSVRIVCFRAKVFHAIDELLKELSALGLRTTRGHISVLFFRSADGIEDQHTLPDWLISHWIRQRGSGGILVNLEESVH